MISVIVPTVRGREHWLERCEASYRAHTRDYEMIVIPDKPTVGIAWQEGADRAVGDYIAFSADDIEATEGWWQPAVACCDTGFLPAPLVLHSDGSVQSCGGSWERMEDDGALTEFTRLPFISRSQWDLIGPMIPLHYYTDNWVSWRGLEAGIKTRVCHGYRVVHHLAPERRGGAYGDEQMRVAADGHIYLDYVTGIRDPLADLGSDPCAPPDPHSP